MKYLKLTLYYLKRILFYSIALLSVYFAWYISYGLGEALLDSQAIFSKCLQCNWTGIWLAYVVSMWACGLSFFIGVQPPQKWWHAFYILFFWVFFMFIPLDAWEFSRFAHQYRFVDTVIIYPIRLREDFLMFFVGALCGMQFYMRPSVRRWTIPLMTIFWIIWIIYIHMTRAPWDFC